MTIAQEAPIDAAYRLPVGALRIGFKFEALHTYTERDANPPYWRIRAKHPATGKKWIRPMKFNGNGYELRGPEKPANGKPLYRLHELASRPDDVVILTEGEYKADQLAALGLLVTTSGAADSARDRARIPAAHPCSCHAQSHQSCRPHGRLPCRRPGSCRGPGQHGRPILLRMSRQTPAW